MKRELDYTYRVLDETPLEDLVKLYHPKEKELTKGDMPKTGPPLPLHLREQAVNNLIKNSPVKNVDDMATLRD